MGESEAALLLQSLETLRSVLRGLLAIVVVFGLALGASAIKARRATVRAKLTLHAFQLIKEEAAGLREQVAAMQADLLSHKAELVRVNEVRRRTDEGCARKEAELQVALAELAGAHLMLRRLPPPTLDVEV